MTRATTADDDSSTDSNRIDWDAKRMELAAVRGHDETRQRLLDLGRSEHIVRSLELRHTPLEFARIVAAVERDRSD